MILELLIIIFLLWIWSGSFVPDYCYSLTPDQEMLQRLERDLNSLFQGDRPPKYHLLASLNRSYVSNKENIYLVLRHPERGNFFDYSTLLQVAIHEMAHIICIDANHSKLFHQIEGQLKDRAISKGLLPSYFQPDPDYPCQDE